MDYPMSKKSQTLDQTIRSLLSGAITRDQALRILIDDGAAPDDAREIIAFSLGSTDVITLDSPPPSP